MSWFALVRVAEPWSVGNVLGAIFLVLVIVAIVYWAMRRR
jgi:heme/copper-type cytochrome/quinol oxidase subunit 4